MIRQQELTWDGKAVALNQRTGCRCKGGELEQNKVSKLLEHVIKKAPLKKPSTLTAVVALRDD